jgi:hypothetical protein
MQPMANISARAQGVRNLSIGLRTWCATMIAFGLLSGATTLNEFVDQFYGVTLPKDCPELKA